MNHATFTPQPAPSQDAPVLRPASPRLPKPTTEPVYAMLEDDPTAPSPRHQTAPYGLPAIAWHEPEEGTSFTISEERQMTYSPRSVAPEEPRPSTQRFAALDPALCLAPVTGQAVVALELARLREWLPLGVAALLGFLAALILFF